MWAWLLWSFAVTSGCRPAAPPGGRLEEIHVTDVGIEIQFSHAAALEQVDVVSAAGDLLQTFPVAPGRSEYHLPFRWAEETEYEVHLQLPGKALRERIQSPRQPPPLRAVVELPLGQQSWTLEATDSAGVIVPSDGGLDMGLVVECRRQAPARFRFAVELPDEVTINSDDARLELVENGATLSGDLEIESDYLQVVARLKLTGAVNGLIRLRFEQWTAAGEDTETTRKVDTLSIHLRRATTTELAAIVETGQAVFPADSHGRAQGEQLADTVVLPNPVWAAFRRWLRPSGRLFSSYEPYAVQSLELTNHGRLPLNLVIRSDVVGATDDEPLLDFAPPVWLTQSEAPTADHLLRLDAGETAVATMPLYVRPDVKPGDYRGRMRVYLVGGAEPLAHVERPLHVVRGDPVVSVVVIAAVVASLLAWGFMALGGRRLLARIGTENLARIGMFGSLLFVVSYTARIGGDLLAGVTGPFYIFVVGVANEGVACLLLAALLTLAPRVGVWTMSSLTVFLLNAMFTGQFGLVDLLFVTVSILLGETALALLGVTNGVGMRQPRRSATPGIVARMALAIGLSNAATLYVQYCLIQVLHRLFFATWYVVGVSLITGLLYGGVGAALGTLLGYQLRRTVR